MLNISTMKEWIKGLFSSEPIILEQDEEGRFMLPQSPNRLFIPRLSEEDDNMFDDEFMDEDLDDDEDEDDDDEIEDEDEDEEFDEDTLLLEEGFYD